jgi:hypothetical protein
MRFKNQMYDQREFIASSWAEGGANYKHKRPWEMNRYDLAPLAEESAIKGDRSTDASKHRVTKPEVAVQGEP